MMMESDTGNDMHGGDHGDMPCCQDTADTSHQELCQLTCAAGGCSAVVLVDQEWQINVLATTVPLVLIDPSPLTASQRNLLRPPIGA